MLTALHIENYRAFRALDVAPLARVNLFVGENNVGKTALLDAVDLLSYRDSHEALWRASDRRGEASFADSNQDHGAWDYVEFDLGLLMHGRGVQDGAGFVIEATTDGEVQRLHAMVGRVAGNGLTLTLDTDQHNVSMPLSPNGRMVDQAHRFRDASGPTWHRALTAPERAETRFLSTHRDDLQDVARFWESLVLTPDEEPILAALRILEPDLERLAFVGSSMPGSHARGFVVKLRGADRRLPLGSLGDGMRRLLAITLHLVRARGGVLIVDEIDAGLHHSVMASMWRLVAETAQRLDVQVFATTHSHDCVYALASLCDDAPALADAVALHRIERDGARTVRYAASEVAIAAQHRIEVR